MGVTTDPNDPRLTRGVDDEEVGQAEVYLVLSEEERAKGFVRPVRTTYIHQGVRPQHPTRELTDEEKERFGQHGYVLYEKYPDDPESSVSGRFWTPAQLESGCGTETTMGTAIAETYARNPKHYGATFCVRCSKHLPVEEFVWEDGTVVGS